MMLNSINFLSAILTARFQTYFNSDASVRVADIALPDFSDQNDPLSIFIKNNALNRAEIITLLIALVPHVRADFFDSLIQSFFSQPTDFPQIGGVRGKQFRGFLPTGETVLFVLAGDDLAARMAQQVIFSSEHFFYKKQILMLENAPDNEPRLCGKILLAAEYIELFTTGKISKPTFSTQFPAELVETPLSWQDLVLPTTTMQQLDELLIWLEHGDTLLNDWGMKKHIKAGYRALFHGASGTGKTLTAALLGKQTERDVFRVDLSMVVSKFIGETEKNLATLFDRAESKNWILFFDEADALFGKRTGVRDAHDRYANQEVSYLLQRVEAFDGLVILASNFKSNIDEAFMRRFQSVIHFPMPRAAERLRLWQNTFPSNVALTKDLNLTNMAERYEISGAAIVNVVQFCCLRALKRGDNIIAADDLLRGISREFAKDGKIL